ncbi:MAG: hypothetical protein Q9165_007620 [Trypethelium subeluteriae]
MRSFAVLAGLLCLSVANAFPTSDISLMETLHGVPEGWSEIGAPQPSKRLQFRIALTRPNNALLDQRLLDISTPSHVLYGQHLKRDELKAMLRPDPIATRQIMDWLEFSGVSEGDIVDDGEWINFLTNTSTAEKMMHTKFGIYRNEDAQVDKIRTLQYSVPEQVHQYIDMIQPTTRFGQPTPQRSTLRKVALTAVEKDDVSCDENITPQCLRDLYNATSTPQGPASGNILGFGGFLEQYARYNDFQQFASEYAPSLSGKNFTYVLVNGGIDGQTSQNDSTEANLDVQYGLALNPNATGRFYSVGGRGPLIPDLDQPDASNDENEPWLAFVTYLKNLPDADLPTTLSNSYGEDEQSLPANYTQRVCSEFRDLGLRGVSILVSSGDSGPGSGCLRNDGSNRTRYQPTFPAGCPWVTAVGGTFNTTPEVALAFSSGGFSERFPRPPYQSAVVDAYLAKQQRGGNGNFSAYYNARGRGIPDVAAQGQNFRTVDQGSEDLEEGTSASCPTFAGLVSRINGARMAAGKPPMGFLNPWLYDNGTAAGLNDITEGGSVGCQNPDTASGESAPDVVGAGWNATEGWDAVTGLGTPNLGLLMESALKWVPQTQKPKRGPRNYRHFEF